jgi:hypothetical protein
MQLDTQNERPISAPSEPDPGARTGPGGWGILVIALVLTALAIAALATLRTPAQTTRTRPVYLDPMTAVREGGSYARPSVGPWVDALTRVREAGPYLPAVAAGGQDPMTAAREGGSYAPTP